MGRKDIDEHLFFLLKLTIYIDDHLGCQKKYLIFSFYSKRHLLEIVFNILITRNVLRLNSHKIQTVNCERGEV